MIFQRTLPMPLSLRWLRVTQQLRHLQQVMNLLALFTGRLITPILQSLMQAYCPLWLHRITTALHQRITPTTWRLPLVIRHLMVTDQSLLQPIPGMWTSRSRFLEYLISHRQHSTLMKLELTVVSSSMLSMKHQPLWCGCLMMPIQELSKAHLHWVQMANWPSSMVCLRMTELLLIMTMKCGWKPLMRMDCRAQSWSQLRLMMH